VQGCVAQPEAGSCLPLHLPMPDLARQAPDQPRDDHQPDRRHHRNHRADRHRPTRHRPLPDRRQGQRPADENLPLTRDPWHGEWNYTISAHSVLA